MPTFLCGRKKGVTLECDGTGTMVGSDTLIYRLIFNLTENAIRYNRPDGTVRVSVSQEVTILLSGLPTQVAEYQKSIKKVFFSRSFVWINPVLAEKMAVWVLDFLWFGKLLIFTVAKVQAEESTEKGTVMTVTFPLNKEYKDD